MFFLRDSFNITTFIHHVLAFCGTHRIHRLVFFRPSRFVLFFHFFLIFFFNATKIFTYGFKKGKKQERLKLFMYICLLNLFLSIDAFLLFWCSLDHKDYHFSIISSLMQYKLAHMSLRREKNRKD